MDIDNENKSLQVNLYQERYLFKIHDTNLDDLSECVKQALGSKSIRQFASEIGTTPSTISRRLNKEIKDIRQNCLKK